MGDRFATLFLLAIAEFYGYLFINYAIEDFYTIISGIPYVIGAFAFLLLMGFAPLDVNLQ